MTPATQIGRKPRADAKLKTLDDEAQETLWSYLRDHSIDEALAWLESRGIVTSRGSVSEFYSWFSVRQKLRERANRIQGYLDERKTRDPGLSPEELFEMGQREFSLAALADEDAGTWARIQSLSIKEREARLARDEFERKYCESFIKHVTDERAREIAADSQLGHDEKIAALKEYFFTSDES